MHHGDGYNSSLFCLPVSQTNEQDDEGEVLTHTSLLSVRPLQTVEGYSLDDEDVAIYILLLRMFIIFLPRSDWPDRILKKKAAQSQAPQSDEIIKSLPQMHHIHVDILASMCWTGLLQAQPSVLSVALETHNHHKFIEKNMLKVVALSNMNSVAR